MISYERDIIVKKRLCCLRNNIVLSAFCGFGIVINRRMPLHEEAVSNFFFSFIYHLFSPDSYFLSLPLSTKIPLRELHNTIMAVAAESFRYFFPENDIIYYILYKVYIPHIEYGYTVFSPRLLGAG